MFDYEILLLRYVFTIEDMDTVAPCYEHFLRCLEALVIKGAPGVKVEAKEIKEAEVRLRRSRRLR